MNRIWNRGVSYVAAFLVIAGALLAARGQVAPPAQRAMPAGSYASIALDPASSGVSAVNTASDLLKAQGPDAAIQYFTSVLDATHNFAVARMIRFQLVDLYRQANRPDMALAVLKDIIVETPVTAPPSSQVIQLQGADAVQQGAQ
jgi:hypothetical protein